jgi:putative holliday junction resolvase
MAGRIIGLDVGQKRTGIASASPIAKLAQPYTTVTTDNVLTELTKIDHQETIEAVVIGLPRNLEGKDTQQTHWVRRWVNEVKKTLNAPMFWQDEALTTSVAQQRRPRTTQLDAEAACIILQDWLDSEETSRVNC